jgi:hypothetical protein
MMDSAERGRLIYLVVWVVVTLILWPIIHNCTDWGRSEKYGDEGRVSTTLMVASGWPVFLILGLIALPFWWAYHTSKPKPKPYSYSKPEPKSESKFKPRRGRH